jgi:hypothetical protein
MTLKKQHFISRYKMANTDKPWEHETIADVQMTTTSLIRAQVLTSPTGEKFIGMRKFAIKKDGSEQVTKDGMILPIDAESIVALSDLLATKVAGVASTLAKVGKKDVKKPTSEAKEYLVKVDSKYVRGVELTSRLSKADCFTEKEARRVARSRKGKVVYRGNEE